MCEVSNSSILHCTLLAKITSYSNFLFGLPGFELIKLPIRSHTLVELIRTQEVLPRRFLVHVCGISASSCDAFWFLQNWRLRSLMRRFLVLPELAPSVALSREVKELESDLERRRLAAVAAEEEANKAGLAASLGLTWPLPKRGRGPPSRQRQYEEALCRAIDQDVLPEEIVTKVVPVWWKQGNPLVAPAEEMELMEESMELPKEVMGEPMEETPNEPGTSSTAAPKQHHHPRSTKRPRCSRSSSACGWHTGTNHLQECEGNSQNPSCVQELPLHLSVGKEAACALVL